MATYRISELSAVTSVSSTNLLEISEVSATGYSSKKATAAQLKSYIQEGITAVATVSAGTWQATPIDVAYGGTGASTTASAINALLPPQTGNAGYFLGTNGVSASWQTFTPAGPAATVQIFSAVTSPVTAGFVSVRTPVTCTGNNVINDPYVYLNVGAGHTFQRNDQVYLHVLVTLSMPWGTYNGWKVISTIGSTFIGCAFTSITNTPPAQNSLVIVYSQTEVSLPSYVIGASMTPTNFTTGGGASELLKYIGITTLVPTEDTKAVTSTTFKTRALSTTVPPVTPTNGSAVFRVAATTTQVWSKPFGCRSIQVEVVGGGGGGVGVGKGAGYSKKIINVSAVSSVNVYVGWGAAGATISQPTIFGTYVCATPGTTTTPGIGTGGDINLAGSPAGDTILGYTSSAFGNSFGAGGFSGTTGSTAMLYPHDDPRSPKPGIVIVTEYY